MKKIFFAILILLFIQQGFCKSYFIENAYIEARVLEDGLLSISESLEYNFYGCYDTIYREIPFYSSNISRVSSYSDNEFVENSFFKGNFFVYEFNYNESQCNKKTLAVLNYSIEKAVETYEDLSALQIMLWGDDMPIVSNLRAKIILPNDLIEYWPHNQDISHFSENENEIIFEKQNVLGGDWIEVQVVFERINNNTYSELAQGKGYDYISFMEKVYEFSEKAKPWMWSLILIIPFVLYVFSYIKHSREIKDAYFNKIESSIPYDMPPATVKAILNATTIDSFIATIFDLTSRGYFSIKGDEKNVIIKILKSESGLNDFEKVPYLFLKKYSIGNEVEWNKVKNHLKSYKNAHDFEIRFNSFYNLVEKSFDKKEYWTEEGNWFFLKACGIFGALLIPVMIIVYDYSLIFLSLAYGMIISFLVLINSKILGKWTKNGRIFDLKWRAFKKYLNDYSLLSKHPAQSIAVWEKFLVYAIILGAAKNVSKVMKLKIPDASKSNVLGAYAYAGFYSGFRSTLLSSSRASTSRGGGGGGFGGGHGGGGGGAR